MTRSYTGLTVLITGASSGIGLEFANSFAARGANLILVARRQANLENIAADLTGKFAAKVQIISMDLAEPGSAGKLIEELAKENAAVDVLINNAGFGTNLRVADLEPDRIRREVGLNVTTLTELSAWAAKSMVARDSGVIVNIASTAAYQPVPGMAVYAATKAYVLSFTQALWGELQGTKVVALAVSPGATRTEFFDVAGATSPVMVPASDVVNQTMQELDKAKPGPATIIGSTNRRLVSIIRFIPVKKVIEMVGARFLEDR